jgi:hypothetical protein
MPVAVISRVVVRMCEWVLRVSPGSMRFMDREVDRDVVTVGEVLRELPDQLHPLRFGELMRNRHFVLARDARVAALLRELRGVP